MDIETSYEQRVYAGLLGKVIGVYLGRPVEGWSRAAIEAKWGGLIPGYIHADLGVPLVVVDDDITGTLAFVRALADSGRYADTPEDFYGDNWLNYLLEEQTILWWGGMSVSTEHTAYLRLKQGVRAPASGSMARNGREVAEQIGAQIFIDGFGLVAPGRPELAVELARRAARVSHDGEAVYAAQVVAAMVASAFVEKDMNKLLDRAVGFIPADSLIAKLHRDVRAWAAETGDWRQTHDRIVQHYGYDRYGGGCHVIPNHALMVMAWAHAPDDFHDALRIVTTGGWDTDCNAANVGTVMGLVVGLDGIDRRYPYRAPVADRVECPTADGTDCASDLARLALDLARVGRRIMGWPTPPPPKDGAWHHFSLPGSTHGYLPDEATFKARAGRAETVPDQGGLLFRFRTGPDVIARIETPTGLPPAAANYCRLGVPYLYNGMTLRVEGRVKSLDAPAALRMFARARSGSDGTERRVYSEPLTLATGAFALSWTIDDCAGEALMAFGFEVGGDERGGGSVEIDRVAATGAAAIAPRLPAPPLPFAPRECVGWISNANSGGHWTPPGSDPSRAVRLFGKNEGRGIFVTGHRGWHNPSWSADFHIHAADRAGLILGWRGMERYYAALFTKETAQWIRREYGVEKVLATTPYQFPENAVLPVRVVVVRDPATPACRLELRVDGNLLLTADVATDPETGGCGFLVENGRAGFREPVGRANLIPVELAEIPPSCSR